MSAKCGGCGKFISPADSAKCHACSAFYHKGCVNLAKTSVPPSWRCPDCTRYIVRDNRCDTPVRRHAPTAEGREIHSTANQETISTAQESPELILNLKLLNDELRSVSTELRLFRNQMEELTSSINKCTKRMDSLETRVASLEQQRLQPTPQVSGVDAIIAELKQELNERDQQLLSNDIKIVNLPETSGENPVHLVGVIAVKMGLSIEDRDVVSAERVGGFTINATSAAGGERRPRPLVVRLARRQLRDDLLRSARVRRGITTQDLGISTTVQRFYINERLTKCNKLLFRKAREAGNRLGWKYAWTRRGTVLARKEPGDIACTIRCEADILRLFGTES